MRDLHRGKKYQERQPEHAPAPIPQEPNQAADPHREQDRVHINDLFLDEGQRSQHHVLSLAANIFQILESREVMPTLPDEIGHEQGDSDQTCHPDPRLEELPPMLG